MELDVASCGKGAAKRPMRLDQRCAGGVARPEVREVGWCGTTAEAIARKGLLLQVEGELFT